MTRRCSSRAASLLPLLLLGACALLRDDPFPLTGGQVTRGAEAERLVRLAGVQAAEIPPGFAGNVVRLDTRRVLTVRHFIDADTSIDLRDGVASTARLLERGLERDDMTWTLVSIDPPSATAACSLARGGSLEPWKQAVVVGYSNKWSGDFSLEPVILWGRVLPMPDGLVDDLGDMLLLDIGAEPERCRGLSGSPVLTRSAPSEPWRWVGLLEAEIETSRGDRLGIAVRLPEHVIAEGLAP